MTKYTEEFLKRCWDEMLGKDDKLTKEECENALDSIALQYDAGYVNECNDEFCRAMKNYIQMMKKLIEEHFKLVKELENYRKEDKDVD